MATSAASQMEEQQDPEDANSASIPSSLKFLVANLKNLVPTQLSSDNHSLRKSQIIKLLRANGFIKFLETSAPSPSANKSSSASPVIFQICSKKGHSATDCWHRANLQYVPQQRNPPKALAATSELPTNSSWYLDSGASSHITNSLDRMSLSNSYQGSDAITIDDGRSVPIAHSGEGILPTPHRHEDSTNAAQWTMP
ncbi:hypothetical protein M5K25_012263 [Dendrobium thyrsiflorum]|uniref:Uncharacterized protein n=1 Tax=Dendrobium thyrsiflorum TaxID=117978 RepID=A0ABD0UWR4_DENTH